MMVAERLRRLLAGDFLRDVAKLAFGTLGGRLIMLATLPLVTRLYNPADYALLAAYMALVTTIASIACLRFEIAIPLARTDADAKDLFILSLLSSLGVSLALCAGIFIKPSLLANALGMPEFAPHLWLVPIGVLMLSSYTALQFWSTYARRFGSIARTRVTQAGAGAFTMLSLGWAGVAPLGLLIGNMLALGAGSLRLGVEALTRDGIAMRAISSRRLMISFRSYSRYPLFSTPEALASIAALQVPVLMIAATQGTRTDAGQLFLAMQVMAAPMTLLGASVAQVYNSRAGQENELGRLGVFTRGLMLKLLWVGVAPLCLGGLLSPWMFPAIFGDEWMRAGEIAALIAPWMLFQLIASPVTTALHVTNNQPLAMMLQLVGLFLRVGSVALSIVTYPTLAIAALAASSAVFYAFAAFITLYTVQKNEY